MRFKILLGLLFVSLFSFAQDAISKKKRVEIIGQNYSNLISGYDVYFLIGDSQARGRSIDPPTAGPTPNANTVYAYNGSSLVQVTNTDLPEAQGGSPWPQHGINRYAFYPRKIIYVDAAIGGSTITNVDALGRIWSTSGPGTLWNDALTKLQNALLIPGAEFKATIISGGVNDFRETVKPTRAQFKIDYQSLIDRVNTLVGVKPIYLYQVTTADAVTATQLEAEMRVVITELQSENSNVSIAINTLGFYSQGLVGSDNVHFFQSGNNIIGGNQLAVYQQYDTYNDKIIQGWLSRFSTPLTLPERNAWYTFVSTLIADGNINSIDAFQVYVSSTSNNQKIDFGNIVQRQVDAPAFTVFENVATNGTSNYVDTGFKPGWTAKYSTQDDVIAGVKIGTYSTSAGVAAFLFGANATTGFYAQQGATGIQFRVNCNTSGLYNGETQFQSNNVYSIARNNGNQYLFKNSTQVGPTSAQASISQTTRSIALGARANGSSAFDLFSACEYEYFFAGKFTTLNLSNFINAANTLVATLKTL